MVTYEVAMKYTVQPNRSKKALPWRPSPRPTITFIWSITRFCFYLYVCVGGGVLSSLSSLPILPFPSTLPFPLPLCLPLCSENFYGVSQVVYITIPEVLDEVTRNVLPSRIIFSIGRHRDNQQITLLLLGFDV